MLRLSFILLILCIFFTGCKTQLIYNSDFGFVADDTSVLTQIYETAVPFTEPSVSSSFAVYYIDVGHADAAVVMCDG